MDKIENRDKYLENFHQFYPKVNFKLLEKELENHKYFSNYMKYIKNLESEETKKIIILIECTRERESCDEIIKILRKTHSEDLANELKQYNTSSGEMLLLGLSTQTKIPVKKCKIPDKGSKSFSMSANPRGKCIIINNILSENESLYGQSQRYKHIFEELYFKVKTYYDVNVKRMEKHLNQISKDPNLINDDALIVIFICHGMNEQLLGFDYFRDKNFDDKIDIPSIVNIFSEDRLRRMPKIFIFDCCRIKTDTETETSVKLIQKVAKNENKKIAIEFTIDDIKFDNKLHNCYIIYSCSEGEFAYFNEKQKCATDEKKTSDELTVFGQAFSHCIANYACQESLEEIMARTVSLMKQNEERGNYSKPEIRKLATQRSLKFNVGHSTKKTF